MIAFILVCIYLIFCFLVAYIGRDAFMGFFGVFILSILITPILAAILIILVRPKPERKKQPDNYSKF